MLNLTWECLCLATKSCIFVILWSLSLALAMNLYLLPIKHEYLMLMIVLNGISDLKLVWVFMLAYLHYCDDWQSGIYNAVIYTYVHVFPFLRQ